MPLLITRPPTPHPSDILPSRAAHTLAESSARVQVPPRLFLAALPQEGVPAVGVSLGVARIERDGFAEVGDRGLTVLAESAET